MENTLNYGDDLDIFKRHVEDEPVDLICLDPPFKSDQNDNVLFKEQDETPHAEEQENLTDADSRLMRKNKRSGYEQAYNAQAVVDAEGSQLVLSARVSQCASDRNELAPSAVSHAVCV